MIIKNKQFGTILLICYVILILYIYFYYFLLVIETFDNTNANDKSSTSTTNTEIKGNEKKKLRYIYIVNSNEEINKTNVYKYSFYNKDYKRYLKLYGQYKNYKKYVILKDFEDSIIGNFQESRYNIDVIKTGLYDDNMTFEYTNNYHSVRCYIANDENLFTIKMEKGNYLIYLYALNIGKIKYNEEKKIYSVIVFEEYKIYLNLIAIGFIMLLNTRLIS